ncbi:MAG: (Fe-S)-binding protein, partial [Planctomycetes bacterium]|nr:(Fe-S)-binding protein [Planctomycetota bacterium]
EAAMKGFEKANVAVTFPMGQSCCGLPAVSMGEKSAARDVGLQNLDAFEGEDVDYIVTLCASCASHLKHGVPKLVRKYASGKAEAFAGKVLSYSQFMSNVVGLKPKTGQGKKIAFHSPCHLCRGLGETRAPKDVIDKSGNTYVPTQEEETCCGFGGSFSANFPAVSSEILTQKLDDVELSGADLLVTECPGCVMQLRGGAVKQGRDIEV